MIFDAVIVGGGVMGLSTAWHLLDREPGLKLCVVERDPTYALASTPRSLGGVRQQFSLAENICMSQYGRAFYLAFPEAMAVDGERPDIAYRTQGYLFLMAEEARAGAVRVNALQRGLGAPVRLLEREAVAARFPSLRLGDIALGSFGEEDGWTDPHAILMGLRRKTAAMGAVHRRGEAVAIAVEGRRAVHVFLADGEAVPGGHIVCAAGAWSAPLLATAGVEVPVAPVRRMVFYFEIRETLEPLPLTVEPNGVYFRPEGRGWLAGHSVEEPEGVNFEVDHALFEESIWPALAARCQAFEALRQTGAWAGLYDVNRLDRNMIAGPHPEGPDNLHVLCGFSGHGLQQAPAAGRAIAELVLDGRFVALDLSRLGCGRLLTGEGVREAAIV